jgi:hypothetical protein
MPNFIPLWAMRASVPDSRYPSAGFAGAILPLVSAWGEARRSMP